MAETTETKTMHTPGPWYGNSSAGGHQGLICSEKTGATVAVTYSTRDTDIVGAAPDLLAVAMLVRDTLPGCRCAEAGGYSGLDCLWCKARAAIAKAEGR